MKLVIRLALCALALLALFYLHLFGIFVLNGLALRYGAEGLGWPIFGLALFSFIALTSLVIALIFRARPQ